MQNKILLVLIFLIICNIKRTLEKVNVIAPLELSEVLSKINFEFILDYSIPAKYSNFGHLQYGNTLTGRLRYDHFNENNQYGCEPLTSNELFPMPGLNNALNNSENTSENAELIENHSDTHPIIMVDRGQCSFVTKARNIQNAGGQIAIIINHEQDFDSIFSVKDDGTGEDIKILIILIPELEGNILKEYYKKHEIFLNIDHTFEKRFENSNLQIFFSPVDMKVYHLFNEFKEIDNFNFFKNQKINFNPIYSFDLSLDGEDYIKYLDFKDRCICGSKYCEDFEIVEGRTGNEILVESIKQKCLYLYSQNADQLKYFNYMSEFYSNCAIRGNFTSTCSDETLKKISGNDFHKIHTKIDQCFLMSFNMPKDNTTYTTHADLLKKCKSNIHLEEHNHYTNKLMRKGLPLIFINENIFFGRWNADKILTTLCGLFIDSSKPLICNYFDTKSNREKENSFKASVGYYSLIALTVFGIFIFNLLLFYLCRKCLKKRFDNTINSALNSKNLELKINSGVRNYLQLKLNPSGESSENIVNSIDNTENNNSISPYNPGTNEKRNSDTVVLDENNSKIEIN